MSRARRTTMAIIAVSLIAASQMLVAPIAQADTTHTTTTLIGVDGPLPCC
jgi:hypothetical protein